MSIASQPPLPSGERPPILSEEVGKANRRAQIDGVVAGVAAGFLSGQMTLRMFKQSRNASLLSGLMAGVGVGYVITQESLRLHLAKAQKSSADLREHMDSLARDKDTAPWDLNRREGGAGGQELLEDPYASTRGDH